LVAECGGVGYTVGVGIGLDDAEWRLPEILMAVAVFVEESAGTG